MVVTRFAPSPTGFLHIGGTRTALFNWLYAKHHNGKFLLRIEDTDRKRSTEEAVDAIYGGMKWLGLDWDEEAISQFSRRQRHTEIAQQLLDDGQAYYCYCSPDELAEMREQARAAGSTRLYDGTWRDRDPGDGPAGIDPVVRLKAPLDGETTLNDQIQGAVTVANGQLDDMILLRADGTPTYMLAVVVDDHDMLISHVIRGDDHLTNTFRQIQIYRALGWKLPTFAHMPLLHGSDGTKLSKRHGALGVEAYRDMGFLPEALNNYLLRLGWSHGDDEIISREQAIKWFDLDAIGKGPARFDMDKLTSLNSHYISQAEDGRLVQLILPLISENLDGAIAEDAENKLLNGMPGLKVRANNITELFENAKFYISKNPIPISKKAQNILDEHGVRIVNLVQARLSKIDCWTREEIEATARQTAENAEVNLGKITQPLRAALTGSTASPSIFEVIEVLGRQETMARLRNFS